MSVRFVEVLFHNTNSVDVDMTIEAPAGTVASGPQRVGANASVTAPLGLTNCNSCVVKAGDTTHGEYRQSFGMAAPSSGRPSYLESIEVSYAIGTFSGRVKARTESIGGSESRVKNE